MEGVINWKRLAREPLAWGLLIGLPAVLVALSAIAWRLEPPASEAGLRTWQVLGSGGIRSDTLDLAGAGATAVLGKCTLDLSQAALRENGAVIRANAVMGVINIRVPRGWRVRVQGMPILGRYQDSTGGDQAGGQDPRLIVHGTALLGAVQVVN